MGFFVCLFLSIRFWIRDTQPIIAQLYIDNTLISIKSASLIYTLSAEVRQTSLGADFVLWFHNTFATYSTYYYDLKSLGETSKSYLLVKIKSNGLTLVQNLFGS